MPLYDIFPKNSVGAEIGVQCGGNAKRIHSITCPKEFHLIDPWMGNTVFYPPANPIYSSEDLYHNVCEYFDEYDECYIHRMTSNEAAPLFPDNHFDFLYVDGDHSYEGVKSDLVNYYPKVKLGGIIMGDDYHSSWGGVVRAFDEFATANGLELQKLQYNQVMFFKPDRLLNKEETNT